MRLASLARRHAPPLLRAPCEVCRASSPASALKRVQKHRIGLKGPMTTPIGKGFRSLNLTLRKELGLYANVRPCLRWAPALGACISR